MHGWGMQEGGAGPCMGCRKEMLMHGWGMQEEGAELCEGDAGISMGRGCRILGLSTGEM